MECPREQRETNMKGSKSARTAEQRPFAVKVGFPPLCNKLPRCFKAFLAALALNRHPGGKAGKALKLQCPNDSKEKLT